MNKKDWCDTDDADLEESELVDEYDVTSAPNDFNVNTIFSFIKSGVVKLPPFQRYYVWDLKRASKLIESIILGLPIPQVFLYEESKNAFLIIDGQQRLMTIYFFMQNRFPKDEKRIALRQILNKEKVIPENILRDNNYFEDFNLRLPNKAQGQPNTYNDLNYHTLKEDVKSTFGMRTIRNVILKQSRPPGDASIYEIFSRLNSGGMNLTAQEIRVSLYHSDLFQMLTELNYDSRWRRLIGAAQQDLHMKDIEVLLRGFAMLEKGDNYRPSMASFLNQYSNDCRKLSLEEIEYRRNLFNSFLNATSSVDPSVFTIKANRFNITIFESVFYAVSSTVFTERKLLEKPLTTTMLSALKQDTDFLAAVQSQTTNKTKVETRLRRAKILLAGY